MVLAVGARGGDNVGGGVIGAEGTVKGMHKSSAIQYRLKLTCSALYVLYAFTKYRVYVGMDTHNLFCYYEFNCMVVCNFGTCISCTTPYFSVSWYICNNWLQREPV